MRFPLPKKFRSYFFRIFKKTMFTHTHTNLYIEADLKVLEGGEDYILDLPLFYVYTYTHNDVVFSSFPKYSRSKNIFF